MQHAGVAPELDVELAVSGPFGQGRVAVAQAHMACSLEAQAMSTRIQTRAAPKLNT